MNNIRLLLLAIQWKEWNTVFFLMDGLAGEYFEGFIKSSGEKFYEILKTFDTITLCRYKKSSVFSEYLFKSKEKDQPQHPTWIRTENGIEPEDYEWLMGE